MMGRRLCKVDVINLWQNNSLADRKFGSFATAAYRVFFIPALDLVRWFLPPICHCLCSQLVSPKLWNLKLLLWFQMIESFSWMCGVVKCKGRNCFSLADSSAAESHSKPALVSQLNPTLGVAAIAHQDMIISIYFHALQNRLLMFAAREIQLIMCMLVTELYPEFSQDLCDFVRTCVRL